MREVPVRRNIFGPSRACPCLLRADGTREHAKAHFLELRRARVVPRSVPTCAAGSGPPDIGVMGTPPDVAVGPARDVPVTQERAAEELGPSDATMRLMLGSPWSRLFVVVAGAALVACGSAMTSALSDESGEPRGGADGGASSPAGEGAPSADQPTDNAILLVHAAGLGAFRVCFDTALDQYPLPDRQTMPEANVVGVEVGTAVRLAPLARPAARMFVWEERRLREFTGPLATKELDCDDLVNLSDPTIPKPLATLPLSSDLTRGVHLLVLTGCGPNPAAFDRTVAQCGAGFDGTKGNLQLKDISVNGAKRDAADILPTQVLHLSQPIESARAAAGPATTIDVSFGELGTPGKTFAKGVGFFSGPTPATPERLAYEPEEIGAYATVGFTVTMGGQTLVKQSLADVARLSSVSDLPSRYYGAASNYVLLLLGDPAAVKADAGADELSAPHLLVVPVIDDEDAPDGGASGSAGRDGGT